MTLSHTLNTEEQFEPSRMLFSPWLMWGVTISFVFFQFFLQLSAGVMVGQLMRDFTITPFGAGLLASSFYFIYTLLQTPAGVLVDRFGPRRLLGGGGLICGLGCVTFSLSHSLGFAFLGRLLMGGGASFAFVSSLYLVSQWFPERRFAIMVGLAETIGMLGTLVGNVFLANVLSKVSWRDTMHVASIIACVLGVLCYVIVRDKPSRALNTNTPQSMNAFYKDVKWIIRHTGLWLNGLYSGLMFSMVSVFAAFWALPFLMLYQHTTLPIATFESALIFVGIAIGSPIMGVLYRLIQNKRHFLTQSAFVATLICIWLIYFTPKNILMSASLFLLLGIVCSCYVFNYSIANQIVPKNVRSTSIGFTNTLCVVTAPILQPLIGYFLHIFSRTDHIISVIDYRYALSVIPLTLLLATIIAMYLPEVNATSPTKSME